jgi:hypothetical protein
MYAPLEKPIPQRPPIISTISTISTLGLLRANFVKSETREFPVPLFSTFVRNPLSGLGEDMWLGKARVPDSKAFSRR